MRPLGVTILVILEAIIAALFVLVGVLVVFLTPVFRITLPEVIPIPTVMMAEFLVFFGSVPLLIGIVGFVVAWGLWTGQGWAWTLAVVVAVIGIILELFGLPYSLPGIVINGVIVYYLWQPHVKAFFGKGAVPYQATPAKTPSQPQPPQPGTVIYCTKCGTANPLESRFCRNCGAELKT